MGFACKSIVQKHNDTLSTLEMFRIISNKYTRIQGAFAMFARKTKLVEWKLSNVNGVWLLCR